MTRHRATIGKRWTGLPFLLLLFSLPATAATPIAPLPKTGNYCPGTDIRLIVAEGLSASLDLTVRSRAALIKQDPAMAISDLTAAKATLHLAASRGAAARTIQLIDALIRSRSSEDYTQMLAWFPLLQASLQTMPNDAQVKAAADMINRAEDIMQGDKDANPVQSLKEARHMLTCDDLDIPLQAAIQAQDNLLKQLDQHRKVNNRAYRGLLDSLHNALSYVLGEDGK